MWMTAKDLAERLGKSVRYIQMLAAEGKIEWMMKDGKSKLYDFDSVQQELLSGKIVPVKALTPLQDKGPSAPASFQALGGKLTEKEKLKFSVVNRLRMLSDMPKGERYATVAFFFGISEATVRRYEKEFMQTGVVAVTPRKTSVRSFDQEALEWLQGFMLEASMEDTAGCTKQSAWRKLQGKAAEMGWRIGSRSTAFKIIDRIPAQLMDFARGGNRALDNYFYIRRDCTKLRPMQIIIGDQHIFDYWIADYDKGEILRPECYCWIDMCTKVVYGIALEMKPYNSETVKEALRNGIFRYGLFENTYNDNGKPECSKATNQIIDDLVRHYAGMKDICELDRTRAGRYAVELENGSVQDAGPNPESYRRIFARVKNAKAKDIERFFRTIEGMLADMHIPGHVAIPGASAAQNEMEDKRLRREKDLHLLLDFYEFADVLNRVFEKYHNTVHSTLKMTPYEYLEKRKAMGWKENRSISDQEIDFIMMARTRRVVRNGFIQIEGRYYKSPLSISSDGKMDDAGVWNYENKTVDVRFSPFDPSYIYVCTPDGQRRPMLLDDTANIMLDDVALKEKMAEKRARMKAIRQAFKVATAMIGDVMYKPDRSQPIEEQQEQQPPMKQLPKPKVKPFRPDYFAHGWERYAWYMDMVLTGNMEYLTDEDRSWALSYRKTEEYRQNEVRWTLIENEIKARGIA